MPIHASAIVDPKAELDSTVEVGPFSVIGPHVKIGARTKVGPHMIISGHTTIGEDNVFHGSATIGGDPQDKKYKGEPTELIIGDRNTVREYCTFNTGTVQDGGKTTMTNDNWIMAYVHIAHDCHIGSNTIIANSVQLAGHVIIGDWVILGGMSGVHQFIRVGDHAMTAFQTKLMQDVPPFVMAAGYPAAPAGINSEGLKRRGFSPDAILNIKRAYKAIYRQGLSIAEAKEAIDSLATAAPDDAKPHLVQMKAFLDEATRGIIR
ncbi:MAG: acyl-[acyl-carrier-protein]--UDP-N-acetylglucosamine O-acyltransferase [Limnobacter sp. CACIAM 66H1]|uniref:acyl-ACP--UDP-N-acetylglucosamine O-acyltransferase n=1 Tax=Limnobacter sp. CACIAM 66H1 TaxID=1813033 RepID=UPI0007A915ED|nr:acyl-ACP--UDP-N-acetylglucosamine O-acyltransferase [Limnobacter sp. CACIAM 66H1]KYP12612.1 MAG: acyl-[acyl-carrier-protein]--UDP-N-acetylglucosamine O-acyltransferase [Limnobacter sp. CACIAM 66H1]